MPEGFIMESAACAVMPFHDEIPYILALMNSKIVKLILAIKNPTLNMQAGDIVAVPVIEDNSDKICNITKNCITVSKNDWDSFETSWDFKRHPLLPPMGELAADKEGCR